MTPEERYILNYFSALKALRQGRDDCEAMASNFALPESQRAEASAMYLDFEDEIAHLKSAHEAIMAQHTGPNPPSDALVQESERIARELAKVIAEEMKTLAMLRLVTALVDAWTNLGNVNPASSAIPMSAPHALEPMTTARAAVTAPLRIGTTEWLRRQ